MDECQNLRIASEVELTLERRAIRAEDIRKVLVRADSVGRTHDFLDWLTARSRRLPTPSA